MKPQVAVPPVQRPHTGGLHIAQTSDRKSGPVRARARVRPPRRPALHDRQMPIGDVHLDPNLVTDMLGYPVPTPSPHTRDIRLRQTTHPTSVQPVPLRRSLESAPSQWGQFKLTLPDIWRSQRHRHVRLSTTIFVATRKATMSTFRHWPAGHCALMVGSVGGSDVGFKVPIWYRHCWVLLPNARRPAVQCWGGHASLASDNLNHTGVSRWKLERCCCWSCWRSGCSASGATTTSGTPTIRAKAPAP
jgi:hypothetical protein